MGFPLDVLKEQDVLNMGICLLTSTPLFIFLQEETTHWGMGESSEAVESKPFLAVKDIKSSGAVVISGVRQTKYRQNHLSQITVPTPRYVFQWTDIEAAIMSL